MKSKRNHEGYLLIDHRGTPGLSDEETKGVPIGSGRGLFEAPTYTCSHCQLVTVINPLRTRERAWCRKCDHYICDNCGTIQAVNGVCKPYKQFLDELQEEAFLTEEIKHG